MRLRRSVPRFVLSPSERMSLEQYARRPTRAQASRFAPGSCCAARPADAHGDCGGSWHDDPDRRQMAQAFRRVAAGGLVDEPRPGAPRKIMTPGRTGDRQHPRIDTGGRDALEHAHLAKQEGLRSMVHRVWQAIALQPHRIKTFKVSNDPKFAEKVVDIVGLYLNPPEHALVLCVDEKSQIQALDRTQKGLPIHPGRLGTTTHDYKRNGTTTLFAALIVSGTVIGACMSGIATKSGQFLKRINRPHRSRLAPGPRQLCHSQTPHQRWLATSALPHALHADERSWLNLVERWFREITRKQIKRGTHRSIKALRDAITAYIDLGNDAPKPFVWSKTADEILDSVARFCTRISDSRH